jgi:hypothetical protein
MWTVHILNHVLWKRKMKRQSELSGSFCSCNGVATLGWWTCGVIARDAGLFGFLANLRLANRAFWYGHSPQLEHEIVCGVRMDVAGDLTPGFSVWHLLELEMRKGVLNCHVRWAALERVLHRRVLIFWQECFEVTVTSRKLNSIHTP